MAQIREIYHAREGIYLHQKALPPIALPQDYHLLVTTQNQVYSWRPQSTHTVFVSQDGGIVGAKEAGNGTGILAVADSHMVVLSNTGHSSRKYPLKAKDGRVCLISFANDCKDIIYSTSMQTSLRRYSIALDQLLDFSCTHPSAPTALAVSLNSTYVVSASASPPVVYLQDLRLTKSKIQIKPHASSSPVRVASFHPERDEIFLLGYVDGTLSVHTASRIVLMRSIGSDGSIGHLKRLHRVTNARVRRCERRAHHTHSSNSESVVVGEKAVGITAAAFMGGYKLRVVSVAGDGKCRVVDFEHGTSIIRTWQAQAPCTSLAVYSPAKTYSEIQTGVASANSKQSEERKGASTIIAIGRTDGWLLFYDALGLLRDSFSVGRGCEQAIGLDWVSDHMQDVQTTTSMQEQHRQPGVADVQWAFKDTSNERLTPSPISNVAHENESPPTRLIDSLRSSKIRPMTACNSAEADTSDKTFNDLESHQLQEPHASKDTSEAKLEPNTALTSTSTEQETADQKLNTDASKDAPRGNEAQEEPVSKTLLADLASGLSTSMSEETLDSQSSTITVVHSPKAVHDIPYKLVEQSNTNPSPITNAAKRTLPAAVSTPALNQSANLGYGAADSQSGGRTNGRSLSPQYKVSKRSMRSGLSPVVAWERKTDDSPTPRGRSDYRGSSRGHESRREFTALKVVHQSRPQTKLDEANMTAANRRRRADQSRKSVSVPPAPPSSPLLATKAWIEPSWTDSSGDGCTCDCANVIREEMVLVRAEIASLRKGLWVLGSQIEMAGMTSGRGSPDDGVQTWFTPVGK